VFVKTSCNGRSVGEINYETWVIVLEIALRVGSMNPLGMSLSNQLIPMDQIRSFLALKFGMTTLGLRRRRSVV
jgi:hypothetical protein